MDSKHTPGPWHVDKNGDIRSADGRRLAEPVWALKTTREEGEANAAFIVRACNSHGALVAALEKCHVALQQFAVHNAEKEAMAEARAALKLAQA